MFLNRITSGKLFSRACGPGLVIGAHVSSLRCNGQKAGDGSRFSCLEPAFLPTYAVAPSISLLFAVLALSSRRLLLHLSERFRFVSITLLACTERREDFPPAVFSRVIPSTKTLDLGLSIVSTLPSSPANSPRKTLTLSPFLIGIARVVYLVFRSSDR